MYARMKKIHSKLKALEWSQHFSLYKSIGIFSNAQGQVTHPWLDPAEIRTHPRYYGFPYCLQE